MEYKSQTLEKHLQVLGLTYEQLTHELGNEKTDDFNRIISAKERNKPVTLEDALRTIEFLGLEDLVVYTFNKKLKRDSLFCSFNIGTGITLLYAIVSYDLPTKFRYLFGIGFYIMGTIGVIELIKIIKDSKNVKDCLRNYPNNS